MSCAWTTGIMSSNLSTGAANEHTINQPAYTHRTRKYRTTRILTATRSSCRTGVCDTQVSDPSTLHLNEHHVDGLQSQLAATDYLPAVWKKLLVSPVCLQRE